MIDLQIKKIINVANELAFCGKTGASTSEVIAAAFVLNNTDYLPDNFKDIIEAWDRLDDWQQHVRTIKKHHMDLVDEYPQHPEHYYYSEY